MSRPMCRDCADNNGMCPHSGEPCDPEMSRDEHWKRKIIGAMVAQKGANKKLLSVIREIRRDKKRDRKSA